MFTFSYKFGRWFIKLQEFPTFQEAWDYATKVHLSEHDIRGAHLDTVMNQAAFVAEKDKIITKYIIAQQGENLVIDI